MSRFRDSHTARPTWAVLALIGLLAIGCAAGPSPEDGVEAPASEAAAAEEPTEHRLSQMLARKDEAVSIEYPEPPDGVWLEDDEGRAYFVLELPKIEGEYRWVSDDVVRIRGGLSFELAGHDETTLYAKVYRVDPSRRLATPGLSDEERAAVAASYRADTPEGDVLELLPFDEGLPEAGRWRNGFDLADMNEDGHLDLVHCTPRAYHGAPIIYLGDGAGHWERWAEAAFPRVPYDYGDAVVTDFNGDGHLDLALGIHLRGVVAMVGDGKGGFELWTEGIDLEVQGEPGRIAFTSKKLATPDWNGDGRPDILAFSEGPRGFEHAGLPVSYGKLLYLNNGDGTWEKHVNHGEFQKIFGDHLVMADFDGDGREDFATSTSVQSEQRLLNFHNAQGRWEPRELEGLRPRAYVLALETADFDGDSQADLAVGFGNREAGVRRAGIELFLRRGDGWERQTLFTTDEAITITALAGGDLDADGVTDLVALTHDGQLWSLLGDGSGGFVLDRGDTAPGEGCRGYQVSLRDLDGAPGDEIVANFSGSDCEGLGRIAAWKARRR